MLRALLIALLGAAVFPMVLSHAHSSLERPENVTLKKAGSEQGIVIDEVNIATRVQAHAAISELRIRIRNSSPRSDTFQFKLALLKGASVERYQLDGESEVTMDQRRLRDRTDFQIKPMTIPAHGLRVLTLHMQSPLEQIGELWRYQLPMGFAQGATRLKIQISAAGLSGSPKLNLNTDSLRLSESGQNYQLSLNSPSIQTGSFLIGTLKLSSDVASDTAINTAIKDLNKVKLSGAELETPVREVVSAERPVASPVPMSLIQSVKASGSTDRRFEVKSAPPVLSLNLPKSELYRERYDSMNQVQTNTAKYQHYIENAWKRVEDEPVSTFSADVDTGSYANVRRFLQQGQLPARDAVRTEELVNYFPYEYAPPAKDTMQAFSTYVETSVSPWNKERLLMRVAIKGRDTAKEMLPAANLVFLVDVSGSMSSQERLPLVKAALKLLTTQLRAKDHVSLVTYADGTGVALAPTSGSEKEKIMMAIDQLRSGGSTNGEGGLRLAYQQAHVARIEGGINRVLLATDGDLNVGITNPDELKALVERERKAGVSLSTLGVGDHNYNDALMKKLADNGNGSYHYLDSLQEAHKVLVNEFTSNLSTIAQDLKLQLEFNPKNVAEYRLLGYELRALTREQFNDDNIDAGDIGAGHTVTALFEIVPTGASGNVDPLRYGDTKPKQAAEANGSSKSHFNNELAWLKMRYKNPGESKSNLIQIPITKAARAKSIEDTDKDFRFATAVAAWSQWLRGSSLIGDFSAEDILKLARDARGEDKFGHRAEFIRLVELSATMKSVAPKTTLSKR